MADDLFGAMLSGLLGGYLADRLVRCVRPKKESKFNSIPFETLKRRNWWIEVAGATILWGGMLLIFAGILAAGSPRNPWLVGVLFGFPMSLTLLFVNAVTLPGGLGRCREYWRYHELKNKTRLALLLCAYVPLAILGVVSSIKAFL